MIVRREIELAPRMQKAVAGEANYVDFSDINFSIRMKGGFP
jgi:hypothetical protein